MSHLPKRPPIFRPALQGLNAFETGDGPIAQIARFQTKEEKFSSKIRVLDYREKILMLEICLRPLQLFILNFDKECREA